MVVLLNMVFYNILIFFYLIARMSGVAAPLGDKRTLAP
jgi:hypothetical protein